MEAPKLRVPPHVRLSCYKCTRQELIPCDSEASGDRIAHNVGWRGNERGNVCPKCSGGYSRRNLTLDEALAVEAEILRFLAEHEAANPAADEMTIANPALIGQPACP